MQVKVKILKNGNYKEFEQSGGMRAQYLEAGDEPTFPQSYADYLVTVGLAKPLKAPATKPLELPEPVEKDEPVAEVAPAAIDPATLTVAEVKALELDAASWQALLEAEEQGKSRKSVLEYAESKLD